ncbi:MAG TPA: single-stranded DNA-binding protein [bacterium]|nr:single-stranded DNA-binding protein [bacterium]
MADVNHVIIIGRLTRDCELKYTNRGMAIANLSLAVNRRIKKGDQWTDEVSFFEANLWGKTAEGLKPYLLKGKQIAVEGELKQERWEQDGQSRSKVVINASNVQLLGGNDKPAQQRGQGSGYQAQAEYSADNFPEDIPF